MRRIDHIPERTTRVAFMNSQVYYDMNVVGHQAHEEKCPNSEEAGPGPDQSGTAHNTEQEQSTDDGDFVNPLPRKRKAISKAPLSRKRHAEDAEASPVIPPKKRLASATRHSPRSPRPETQTIRVKKLLSKHSVNYILNLTIQLLFHFSMDLFVMFSCIP